MPKIDEIIKEVKKSIEDYSQLKRGYPNAEKFLNSFAENVRKVAPPNPLDVQKSQEYAINRSFDVPGGFGGMISAMPLYHGSNFGKVKKINKGDVFDGIFASPDKQAALSHGEHITNAYVNEKKILDDISQSDVSYDEIIGNIKKWYPEATQDEVDDFLYPAIVEDKTQKAFDFDRDRLRALTGYDDPGEASWSLQNDRGRLAKLLGFDAVKMADEHGTSYFIPYGSKAKLR